MRTRTIAAIVAVVIIVIAVAGAAFLLTLQAPQVEGVSVRSIDNVSRSGFTITFVIKLYNPNVVGVTVNSVNYKLLLTEGSKLLSNGTSGEFQVPARGSVEIPIQSTIYFSSAISVAFQTIFTKSVMMDLSGVVNAHALITDVNVPFSQTFDAYPYIKDATSNIA
jgi:LEA14-like dessication related protein